METLSDDLLVKVIVGEATTEEYIQVEQWLLSDPAHRQYFDELKRVWELSKVLNFEDEVDVEKAWNTFQSRKSRSPFSLWRKGWLAAAAAVVIVGGGVWFGLFSNAVNNHKTYTASNAPTKESLPDGSAVTLNKNAVLTYSAPRLHQKDRSLRL